MGICSSKESYVTRIGANGPQLGNPNGNAEIIVTGGVLRMSLFKTSKIQPIRSPEVVFDQTSQK